MPVSVATIGRQRTLAGLAKSVFGLEDAPAAAVRNASDLLLRANPHLAEEGALKPGVSVLVPDDPQLTPDSRAAEPVPVGRDRLAEIADKHATALKDSLTTTKKRADAVYGRQRELLRDEGLLRAFAELHPAVANEFDRVRKAIDMRAEAAEVEAAAFRKGLQRLRKAFEADGIRFKFADADDQ